MSLHEVRFASPTLGPRCSANIVIEDLPQGAVPVWLEVPDDLAGDFVVTDVKVGLDSQLCAAAVPASLFARGAPRDELLLDPVREPRGSLTISLANLSSRRAFLEGRVVFSSEDSRLARYRRARLVGLGVLHVAPQGLATLTVQPMWELVPDRFFVPRPVLEKVDVVSLRVFTWVDGVGAGELLDVVSPEYLSRENLAGDGCFSFDLGKHREVNPRKCLVAHFRNRTDSPATVTGAVLGGVPLRRWYSLDDLEGGVGR